MRKFSIISKDFRNSPPHIFSATFKFQCIFYDAQQAPPFSHLNRAYYDYFLEGLLLGFITFYLPVISMATYINEAYKSERLMALFGKSYVLKFDGREPVLIGALFCFILSVVFIIASIFINKRVAKRYWPVGKDHIPDCDEEQYQGINELQPNRTLKKI